MSKTSAELELELKEVKAAEKFEQENKEMEDLRKAYVGKAYGEGSFTQNSKFKHNCAIFIKSIERAGEVSCRPKGTIECNYISVRYSKGPDYSDKRSFMVNYQRCSSYNHTLNGTDYNMGYAMHSLVGRMKEIPVTLFESLYQAGDEVEPIINDAFCSKLDLKIEKTCGDSTDQDRLLKDYAKLGIELIDVEKYPKLLNAIRYARIPGFIQDRFLIKQFAKASLKLQISNNEDRMSDSWCTDRVYSALERENAQILDHIKLLKL